MSLEYQASHRDMRIQSAFRTPICWWITLTSFILFATPSLGLSYRCRALLKNADPNDAFDTVGLACPFETVGQFPERACRNSLDAAPPEIKPTYLSEANRLPDYEFQDMVFGEFAEECSDIFASPEFASLLRGIPEMDVTEVKRLQSTLLGGTGQLEELSRVQRQMANVLSQVDWSYCHKLNRGVNVVEHASFKADTRQIVLYASACIAQDIYNLGLDKLSLSHRFALISAHEVGHAVDSAAGNDLGRSAAEDFATLVGTFFAQCHGRIIAHLIREAAEPTETVQEKKERARLVTRYGCYEEKVLEIRAEVIKLIKKPRDLRKRTRADGVFSCATFLDNEGDKSYD